MIIISNETANDNFSRWRHISTSISVGFNLVLDVQLPARHLETKGGIAKDVDYRRYVDQGRRRRLFKLAGVTVTWEKGRFKLRIHNYRYIYVQSSWKIALNQLIGNCCHQSVDPPPALWLSLVGWWIGRLTSPFSTTIGLIGDKVLGGDLVPPGEGWPTIQ